MKGFWGYLIGAIVIIGLGSIIFVKATKQVGGKTVTGAGEAAQIIKSGGSTFAEGVKALEGG